VVLWALGVVLTAGTAWTAPGPPTDLQAADAPDDRGGSITVTWTLSSDDGAGAASVTGYRVYRAEAVDGPWRLLGKVSAGASSYTDSERTDAGVISHAVSNGTGYYYLVRAIAAEDSSEARTTAPAFASAQWFWHSKLSALIVLLAFSLLVIVYVEKARKRGEQIYVRPIAGMDALDEAVGRATEMGRPVLYIPGLGTAGEISTIASFAILSRVAKKIAQYGSRLIVPNYDPIVMAVCHETVRQSYTDAGRPDLYNEKDIFFVTHAQFAYVAAVNGIMLRERTATNLYLGRFYAESLILAETGNLAGSIQIAGTDEAAQLPFFVTACDYTLIGEELYAASAYLSREPLLLGALKTQDIIKGVAMIWLIVGAILVSLGVSELREWIHVRE
jgi:hypothetical protein